MPVKKPQSKPKKPPKKVAQKQKQKQKQNQKVVVNINTATPKNKKVVRRKANTVATKAAAPNSGSSSSTTSNVINYYTMPSQSSPSFSDNIVKPINEGGSKNADVSVGLGSPVDLPVFAKEGAKVIGSQQAAPPLSAPVQIPTPYKEPAIKSPPIIIPSAPIRPVPKSPSHIIISTPPSVSSGSFISTPSVSTSNFSRSGPSSIASTLSNLSKATGITSSKIANFIKPKPQSESISSKESYDKIYPAPPSSSGGSVSSKESYVKVHPAPPTKENSFYKKESFPAPPVSIVSSRAAPFDSPPEISGTLSQYVADIIHVAPSSPIVTSPLHNNSSINEVFGGEDINQPMNDVREEDAKLEEFYDYNSEQFSHDNDMRESPVGKKKAPQTPRNIIGIQSPEGSVAPTPKRKIIQKKGGAKPTAASDSEGSRGSNIISPDSSPEENINSKKKKNKKGNQSSSDSDSSAAQNNRKLNIIPHDNNPFISKSPALTAGGRRMTNPSEPKLSSVLSPIAEVDKNKKAGGVNYKTLDQWQAAATQYSINTQKPNKAGTGLKPKTIKELKAEISSK